MSQHDMIVANGAGSTVRADINDGLQALASTSKGTAAPSTVYAGQHWIDDNTPSGTKWSEFVNDGTDNIKIGEIDTTNNVTVQQVGGGSAQSIASAGTTDLGSVFEATIVVTGTTTITSFGSSAPLGAFKFVKFSGALTLTHHATSLIVPGGANITTADGDCLMAEHLGSGNWRVHHYQRNQVPPLSGTYTPTLTNGSNVAASSAGGAQYMQVGGVITVSGYVNVDPTTTNVATELGISLPVASNFSNVVHCCGTAGTVSAGGENTAVILADSTNDRASLNIIPVSVASLTWYFIFSYRVI